MLKRVFLSLALLLIVTGVGFWAIRHHNNAGDLTAVAPAAGTPAKNGDKAAAPAGGPPPGMPVEAQKVQVDGLENAIDAVGNLLSNESVILSPEISGRVTEILFEEGQEVKKGEILVRLDDTVNKAELAEAQASLVLSKANNERANELYKDQIGTGRAKDEAISKLNADTARVALVKAHLDKTVIRAPFDGIVGLRKVSAGDYVNPGQELVNLESIDPLKVDFRISEIYLNALKPGQTIEVMVDAFPGRTFSGEVYAIDPQIDNAGRTVALRARLTNDEKILRPGLFARVRLVVDKKDSAILIPEQALMPQGNEQFVYKVIDGKAVMTKVTTGARRTGMVEILAGLTPDDTVITAGHMKVRPDAPVTIVPVSDPATPEESQ